jgi:hypothetical protein
MLVTDYLVIPIEEDESSEGTERFLLYALRRIFTHGSGVSLREGRLKRVV